MKTCNLCTYRFLPEGGAPSQCRRYAPMVTGGLHSEIETVWPVVGVNDWCGEWEPLPPIQQPRATRAQQLKELIPNLDEIFSGEEVKTIEEVMDGFGEPREGRYMDPRLNIPVDEVVGTSRGRNCLKNLFWGEKTYADACVGDLVQYSEKNLLNRPGLGRRTLNDYKGLLARLGEPCLHLGMNPEMR